MFTESFRPGSRSINFLLVDGDTLEKIRPLEEPYRYFSVIVRYGKIYKNTLPGENPVRARQSYKQRGES